MNKGVMTLFALSAAANIVLVATGPGASREAAAPSAARASRSGESAVWGGGGTDADPRAPAAQAWAALETSDPAVLLERLRASGFPDTIAAALVRVRIEARFDARRLAVLGPEVVQPYWKTIDLKQERERRALERELTREKRAMQKELLGPGGYGGEMRSYYGDRLGFLPPERAELIGIIEADYAELMSDVRGDTFGGVTFDEDREKLQMIEREKQADIAAVLTPEERELFDLHRSRSADIVRSSMRNFDATEQEFLAVYELQKAFDERYPSGMGPPSREEGRARSDALRALSEETRVVLGEARSAELARSRSGGYQAAVRIVEHFNLPRENATAVQGLETEYRTRREDLARQMIETPQDRPAAFARLAAEATARVEALLGVEGAAVYREQGGTWLRTLEPQASRPVTPRP